MRQLLFLALLLATFSLGLGCESTTISKNDQTSKTSKSDNGLVPEVDSAGLEAVAADSVTLVEFTAEW